VIAAAQPGDAANRVTEFAGDPVYPSPRGDQRYPDAKWFARPSKWLRVPDSDLTASVIACPVTFAGDRWLAEVVLTPPAGAAAYRPFVRLAVARYQPESVPGMELSPVVTTERVSLLPDREIVVERAGELMRVHVSGVGPQPANRIDIGIDEAPEGTVPELIAFDPTTAAGFPVWRPLPLYARTGDASGAAIEVPLPPGGRPLRLRIREVEDLAPLGDRATPAERMDAVPPELTERTVLIDHIPIPSEWRPSRNT
jgi:hypothetical protein